MDVKKAIEQATVDGFLSLYNDRVQADFYVVKYSDSPDATCRDSRGRYLNIEVTMTEDKPDDIQALLGRSNHKSVEALEHHIDQVRLGLEPIQYSSLRGNVLDQIVKCITQKLINRYGPHTALVVRDTSPVSWNWDSELKQLCDRIGLSSNPFDEGIWILDYTKINLYQII